MSQKNTKTVNNSTLVDQVYKVFPNDLNANKTLFGGKIMALADRLSLVVAEKHSNHVCVTASVDSVHFLAPAKENDTLIISASINRAWTSSMEIGVRVDAENTYTGERRHVVSAYSTFVALGEDGRPVSVPKVLPETDIQKERYEMAQIRREGRLNTRDSLNAYLNQSRQGASE
ncbi:MAG: acyl-CoA thioesterase [Pseudomonadota bacterium]|nr:acyl-CoA thioesterase [Pseudomonadota bacterium]